MTHRNFSAMIVLPLVGLLALVGCSSGGSGGADGQSTASPSGVAGYHQAVAGTMFDPGTVHTIAIDVDGRALATVLDAYSDSGKKKWAKAKVTIDGQTFAAAGIRLKGTSSLEGVTSSAKPEDLPWRIRLDKYIGGRNIDVFSDFTVRHNSSETSMNEAVALDMLAEAGLASEHAVETRFTVNGSEEQLRLTVQNPDQTWVDEHFPDAGSGSVLYKAETGGDWEWRGSDGDYSGSFGIAAGPKDYDPLIALLDLVNNASDDEIAEKLPTLVDVDSFADYLALETMISNHDDISGRGNNSYLFWDTSAKKFTVVAWDHNNAFAKPRQASGRSDNPLVTAAMDQSAFADRRESAATRLAGLLIDDNALQESVDRWSTLLTEDAGDLVSPDTVADEAATIRDRVHMP